MPQFPIYPETPLIAPPGRKKGLLWRNDKPGESCGFLRDLPGVDIIPQQEWGPYINANLSMRPWVNWIYDQNGVGSCAAESACGGLDLCRSLAGDLPKVKFNPWGTYYYTSGGRDQGSTLPDNLKRLREYGAVPESLHPRSLGWSTKPSAAALEAAKQYRIVEFHEINSWDEFGSALIYRFPIYWGYTGHAILGVQLLSTSQFVYRNSWSQSWGDQGFGIISASRIEWGYGVYAIRTCTMEQEIVIPDA